MSTNVFLALWGIALIILFTISIVNDFKNSSAKRKRKRREIIDRLDSDLKDRFKTHFHNDLTEDTIYTLVTMNNKEQIEYKESDSFTNDNNLTLGTKEYVIRQEEISFYRQYHKGVFSYKYTFSDKEIIFVGYVSLDGEKIDGEFEYSEDGEDFTLWIFKDEFDFFVSELTEYDPFKQEPMF